MGKSTGPRSLSGKLRSGQNAGKHWIESGRILPGEQEDAAILRKGLIADFKPGSLLEIEIIEDLTLNRVVKRRIDQAFTREFSRASIGNAITLREKAQHSVTQYGLRTADLQKVNRAGSEHAERLRPTHCIQFLEKITRGIIDRGPQLTDLEELREVYGDEPTEAPAAVMAGLTILTSKKPGEDGDETLEEKHLKKDLKKDILNKIQIEIDYQRDCEEFEREIYADAPGPVEPPAPMLDTLLRYRSANLRELKDLLDCLERFRRLRKDAL